MVVQPELKFQALIRDPAPGIHICWLRFQSSSKEGEL